MVYFKALPIYLPIHLAELYQFHWEKGLDSDSLQPQAQVPTEGARRLDFFRLPGETGDHIFSDLGVRAEKFLDGPDLTGFAAPAVEAVCRALCRHGSEMLNLVVFKEFLDVSGEGFPRYPVLSFHYYSQVSVSIFHFSTLPPVKFFSRRQSAC